MKNNNFEEETLWPPELFEGKGEIYSSRTTRILFD